MLVEKYVERPRHIEIQVFGDSHGDAVYLFERDCSVQRRHQKVLEEAPAPGMSAERRAAMGKAAVDAARAVGYEGAGTVEFIAGPDGDFYFMEMNTRLQVEHPVTEYITGTDLVEWQLRVARACRCRCARSSWPSTATRSKRGCMPRMPIEASCRPPAPCAACACRRRRPMCAWIPASRKATASPYYDPMIAKLIVWDVDRDAALRRMSQALADCQVVGVTTNAGFLRRLVNTDSFTHAKLDTALIEREQAALSAVVDAGADLWLLAAVAAVASTAPASTDARDPHSPWQSQDGWRPGAPAARAAAAAGRTPAHAEGVGAGRWLACAVR